MFDVAVWTAQGFLALFFFFAGLPKIAGRGIEAWAGFDQISRIMTIGIGVAEVAGAIALVVPLLVDRFEWLTPLAAFGIAVMSLMASGFHVRAREWVPNITLALWAMLAGTTAVARWSEFATGPSISRDALVLAVIVLVPAILISLVIFYTQLIRANPSALKFSSTTPPAKTEHVRS
jgi:hypothetical protein